MTRRWGLLTSALAPVVLIGGWTLAASLVPGFDSTRDTISALAMRGAPHRWVMTTAFVLLGLCHLGTAAALRPVRGAGRVTLALGGVLTMGVALFPLAAPGSGTDDSHHGQVAAGAFACLCAWPLLGTWPGGLRVTLPAFVVLLALLGWFVVVLGSPAHHEGLAERFAAGSQALWPLATVVLLSLRPPRAEPARP